MAFIRKVVSRGYAYAQLVHTERVNGKVKTKVLSHLGPWSSLNERFSKPLAEQIDNFTCYEHGSMYVLNKICDNLNLDNIIHSYALKGGGLSAGILSKILIINHCVDPTSKVMIPKWIKRTTLPELLNIPPDKINKDNLIKVLDYFNDKVIESVHCALVDRLISLFGISKESLMYDITSTYLEGNCCEDAVLGYSRDKIRGSKQVNFGLMVSRMGKFPLLFRYFKGNTVDVTTVTETAQKAKDLLKLNKTSIVMDRGMLSEENVKELDKLKLDYIICLKRTNEVISKMRTVSLKDCTLIDEDKELYAYENTELHNNKEKKMVVCISKPKVEEDREKREKKLKKVEEELDKLKSQVGKRDYKERDAIVAKRGEILLGAKSYFTITHGKDELDFSFSRNNSKIKQQEGLDGKYALLCSDKNTSIEEIVQAYKDKDKVEKAFRVIKSYIHVRPIRHWKPNRVKAHIFICVLAYLVEKVLEYEYDEGQKTTAQQLLYQLNSIKKIQYHAGDKTFSKHTAIDKFQQKILKKLGCFPL